MELSNTPSSSHALRRRKKRSTPTSVGPPGSSLNGLNRSSIRYVELGRGTMGYGFTISGQKPCLLRCIVEGSPAEAAFLRPGNCLVGVNGIDVSHRAHDDVVGIIGSCTGLLRLHVADSYFSESSEDDAFQNHHQRPKYPHKPRALSKSALTSKKTSPSLPHSKLPVLDPSLNENLVLKPRRPTPQTPEPRPRRISPSARRGSWDPLMPTPRRASRPPLPVNDFLDSSTPPILPKKKNAAGNPMVEIVSVFGHVEHNSHSHSKAQAQVDKNPMPGPSKSVDMDRFNTQSSSGSSNGRANSLMGLRQISGSSLNGDSKRSSASLSTPSMYQAVVGYIGSMELPEIEQRKRLQALSSCVRRLRLEKRIRSIVLLRIQPNGICLFSANQNVQNGTPPLAFYSSSIIAFCGAYSDDRRFFGLVTSTGPNKSSSCHVFMVEPKLLSHSEHVRRARAFGIECTTLSLPKNGQVLGLQECAEFPATADPILSSILQLHCSPPEEFNRSIPQMNQRSPSEASNRLESTNSSNSDSGIGFRDESDRLSARIYDIVDPEILFETKPRCHSPAPKKRFPFSRKQIEKSIPPQKSSTSSKLPKNHDQSGQDFEEFQSDPNSVNEILGFKPKPPPVPSKRFSGRDMIRDRFSLNLVKKQPPRPIEVSVLVTPPCVSDKRHRSSMEFMTPISPSKLYFESLQRPNPNSKNDKETRRISLTRNNGTRSLDNLCSPEILKESSESGLELKGALGSSTPVLNQESVKGQCADDFWDFKVPQAPKPKMEVNRYDKWAESIEKLLGDPFGLDVFTKFLQGEISAENINFYTRCLEFKEIFPDLTQSQRISKASTIFQCYLQNGATEAINVDCQARNEVEKALSQPTREMFNLPLAQVFDLLKFDCYPRFLRSDMYRDYISGVVSLQDSTGEPSDSDQDSVKSHKLHQDERRRSLLPWNKSRSKPKHRNKNDDALNADISFIQRTAGNPSFDGSDHEDGRRQSCKLCRIHLPDNSATVFPCNPGETLNSAVQRLLEKREFHYSSFEVVSVATGKALDLDLEVSEMISREIRVEPRASVRIELPLGWIVGVRANPIRKLSEVLKPILNQHKLKLDGVVVYDAKTDSLVDVHEWTIGKVDGLSLYVKLKGETRLEEITNQIPFYDYHRKGGDTYMDDDQTSAKTSSSHTSSLFGEFMRKSSKKFKRNKGQTNPSNDGDSHSQNSRTSETVVQMHGSERETSAIANRTTTMGKISGEENCNPRRQTARHNSVPTGAIESPLSLIRSEFNLTENSRNRKPIYITQSTEQKKS